MQFSSNLSGQSSMEDPNEKEKQLHSKNEDQLNQSMSMGLQYELLWVYMASQRKEMSAERVRVIEALYRMMNVLLGSLEKEREILSFYCNERDLGRNEDSLMKEKMTAMVENDRNFVEEMEKLLEERDAARTVLEMNNKELKGLQKKILNFLEEFLGEKRTGESENSELHEEVCYVDCCEHADNEKDRKEKEEAPIADKKPEEEAEQIATDLETIKQAFNNEETMTQGLKLKAEIMKRQRLIFVL
ncbi:hypothetical protein F3Y22_tig00111440pilonHSYRG00038 [Hibiscus syriacus]|uniref:Uncharacterized protein n=1 Tax=Hibiscus syriacus TaxID=106335 RepID=A0A6A2Y392_HIBSY|nr:hypothetical protein F3Y22_tig00111440pilonHSYRG00038 [Hibiscus syriacus]